MIKDGKGISPLAVKRNHDNDDDDCKEYCDEDDFNDFQVDLL